MMVGRYKQRKLMWLLFRHGSPKKFSPNASVAFTDMPRSVKSFWIGSSSTNDFASLKMENDAHYQQPSNAKYDCLLFDLDDTLYPLSSGLAGHVTKNIQEYMLQKLQIEESKVPDLCVSLYKTYGTTMAGLRAIGYKFDYVDFHSSVHGRLPYDLLKPDTVLRALLHSLPIRKVVFTNSDKAHAERVLHRLGLEDCFEGILCFETLNPTKEASTDQLEDSSESEETLTHDNEIFNFEEYMSNPNPDVELPKTPVICKPFEESFERVFETASIDPKKSIRNITTGKHVGLHTVLVGKSQRTSGVDYALESIHNIKEALPELWEENEMPICSRESSIETSVTA